METLELVVRTLVEEKTVCTKMIHVDVAKPHIFAATSVAIMVIHYLTSSPFVPTYGMVTLHKG